MSDIPSILFSDYMQMDTIMSTAYALRDRIFHNTIATPVMNHVEAPTLTLQSRGKRYLVTPELIESENIQLCIQNDDKLIAFLSSIKGRRANVALVFTTSSVVTVLVKSNDLHPILVMRYPIDGVKVYSRTPDQVFSLPLDDIIARSSQSSYANGYALYYKKSIDEETKQTVVTLHYKLPNKNSLNSPPIPDINMEYVNMLLQPSSLIGSKIRKASRVEGNVGYLNDISLIMLAAVDRPDTFKDMGRGSEIDFDIMNDDGDLSMIMKSRTATGFEDQQTITTCKRAIVWQFKGEKTYHMDKKTVLLLQAANQKIKLGTDFLYFAFGRYGNDYVFLKLISSRAIAKADLATPVIVLSKILHGVVHIFEMYFCHE